LAEVSDVVYGGPKSNSRHRSFVITAVNIDLIFISRSQPHLAV